MEISVQTGDSVKTFQKSINASIIDKKTSQLEIGEKNYKFTRTDIISVTEEGTKSLLIVTHTIVLMLFFDNTDDLKEVKKVFPTKSNTRIINYMSLMLMTTVVFYGVIMASNGNIVATCISAIAVIITIINLSLVNK
jgi:hypothetical protein